MRTRLVALLTVFVIPAAVAQTPPLAEPDTAAPSHAAQKPVPAFGDDHPECGEWSDGCMVCTRDGCSLPGIACVSKDPACRKTK
ncbi:hypothetical protein OGR47_02005 [Methylocystis sp. MJC1]|jgi:hypothetical protein|uniref:hypothetical protein n=1 Tax=Methylocystis sp. MJC1 TaxID=2654282 RepID=UPI0013EBB130|nr:hypothetical protein [Methylocystis sp. MJC1]KAF2990553.1 hypothetical protein MJC1_02315 [Methylocystis sp. MJC1]MBU6525786.1 hypothetical protein [Methylocystis sp. MJC1]UZX12253.1 hypothetical protein OGR47_02005 [Methylocystis sp. MJC1]